LVPSTFSRNKFTKILSFLCLGLPQHKSQVNDCGSIYSSLAARRVGICRILSRNFPPRGFAFCSRRLPNTSSCVRVSYYSSTRFGGQMMDPVARVPFVPVSTKRFFVRRLCCKSLSPHPMPRRDMAIAKVSCCVAARRFALVPNRPAVWDWFVTRSNGQ
jgi:hypothetical protein